jgi:hypothetical protein
MDEKAEMRDAQIKSVSGFDPYGSKKGPVG